MQFDREKYKAVILYTCVRCEAHQLGSVKLHKVLYYADMLHYAHVGAPMTGSTYRKRPHGPTSDELLQT
ncbi:MAG: type II toxin-antitoxin system antitoxin SocA domain-containing protein, partial [Aestuariivirgaceae bacterium]